MDSDVDEAILKNIRELEINNVPAMAQLFFKKNKSKWV